MRKKIFLICLLCFGYRVYPRIDINYRGALLIIHKVFEPLKVEIETPEKIRVKSGSDSFRYGDMNQGRSPLKIKIETPSRIISASGPGARPGRDELLQKLYGNAKLVLANQGNFELKEIKDSSKIITGRGFFPTKGENAYEMKLELLKKYEYYANTTSIDVVFNEEKKEMLMGVYKGVLRVDVTYGEM